jgi:hypothetical protein
MRRVIAVAVSVREMGRPSVMGPVDIDDPETARQLGEWADRMREVFGGYVHYFSADGDASAELAEWAAADAAEYAADLDG